jgi:hypothetical protein
MRGVRSPGGRSPEGHPGARSAQGHAGARSTEGPGGRSPEGHRELGAGFCSPAVTGCRYGPAAVCAVLGQVWAAGTGYGCGPSGGTPVAPGGGGGSGPIRVGRCPPVGAGCGYGPSAVTPVVLRHPTPSTRPAHRQGAAHAAPAPGRPPPGPLTAPPRPTPPRGHPAPGIRYLEREPERGTVPGQRSFAALRMTGEGWRASGGAAGACGAAGAAGAASAATSRSAG